MPLPVRRLPLVAALTATLMLLALPTSALGHSELKLSVPAEGATVAAPFSGPVVLRFTLHLATGSKADLIGPDGSRVATAIVDPNGPSMTFDPVSPLEAGAYEVQWTSIGDDGDLLRGIVKFTVATPAATTRPSPQPSASAGPSAAESLVPTAGTSVAPTAAPSPSGTDDTSGTGTDVILPIIAVLIFVAAGAFYLVRRNRPA